MLLDGPAHFSRKPVACCCIHCWMRSLLVAVAVGGVVVPAPVGGYGRSVGRDFLSTMLGGEPTGISGEELELDAES